MTSTQSVDETVRMSHRNDPHTSHEAAEKASQGTKKELLYGAILAVLRRGPATPAEVLDSYMKDRRKVSWLPEADLYDIRRRMSELEHDTNRIEAIVESPGRYFRREGQRVMRLAKVVHA